MSLFRHFQDDPFFGMSNRSDMFGGFESLMFGGSDPFMLRGFDPFTRAIGDGIDERRYLPSSEQRDGRSLRDRQVARSHDPFDVFGNRNSSRNYMQNMFSNMHDLMENGMRGENGAMFSQSSVMSYSNVSGSEPQIYQATSAIRQGPGGLRETRKTVRDTQAGIEKMALGRHINERGHVITKQRDKRSGNIEEHQDFLNIDEGEVPTFDNEWQEKSRNWQYGGNRNELDYDEYNRGNNRHHTQYSAPADRHENRRLPRIEGAETGGYNPELDDETPREYARTTREEKKRDQKKHGRSKKYN